eukprot:Protomagalhaensia_sp_Gyna_25__4771@NODE_477_length_3320_cov_65_669613_g369_i0_p2_GENE_NODE_477_length_3320_cov_65_669613_g369_i0NODE_477_length_3320_cov_65_669613_g369_i0_p2_ORF_typecomplete_len358_score80_34TFIIS_C/PF01096_18/3_1e02TFIIS_C/PF01096_18/1e02TFIIS_C/PF01096_18/9_5e11Zn_Tnp_IS1595/PF12760_7/14Zn_Tnp_IS1595/PF12760_7/5_5zf_Rg/PF17915_1/6_2e03zf_Rg/PF17915_1/0_38UPF0547/PF10571_9/0_63UPF0547/PF10571_9/1_2e02UPF0547/PF10571_9/2_2e02DNA_RNApol_7kD/PF03604_13/3_5DNA_RNApol_7kD/PF03604_13
MSTPAPVRVKDEKRTTTEPSPCLEKGIDDSPEKKVYKAKKEKSKKDRKEKDRSSKKQRSKRTEEEIGGPQADYENLTEGNKSSHVDSLEENTQSHNILNPLSEIQYAARKPMAVNVESGDFRLNASNWLLSHNNLDLLMDLKDQYWCETILGRTPGVLGDLVNIFLRSHNVYADERDDWGPPKWKYSDDPYDYFDYYMRNGCPNCGFEFSTDFPTDFILKPVPVLLCKACGHKAAPLHFDIESEAVVDRLQRPSKQTDELGAIYLRGSRRVHDFGQNGKEWWQSYFLPASYRLNASQAAMAGADVLGDSKGEKVKETCEICGHDEAFFATFQARSADEGLTIMYECTRCHSRKTFNN